MSKSQAIAFFEEISKNQQLAQEVKKVVGGKNSDEAKAKELLSLAKTKGFNFTQEEAASAKGALKVSLSPKDMLEVSGGDGFKSRVMAMALLACLGGSVSTLSNIETSAMKGRGPLRQTAPSGRLQGHPGQGGTPSAFYHANPEYYQVLYGSQEQDGNPFSEPKTNSDPNGAFAVSRTSGFTTYEDTSASEVPVEFMQSHFEVKPTTMPGPRLPADHYRQHAVERRTSLTKEEVKKLAKKYRCGARPEFAQPWVNNVVEKVSSGLRPDFSIPLTKGSHDDFREKCAYCGSGGSVNISNEGENGKYHHIKCENSGCPMNWVCNDGERLGDEKKHSLAPWKYEVKRWGKLPQLIADIEALLAHH